MSRCDDCTVPYEAHVALMECDRDVAFWKREAEHLRRALRVTGNMNTFAQAVAEYHLALSDKRRAKFRKSKERK